METPVIIENLQVWPKDLGRLTWLKAGRAVAGLGPGWRLPTIEEFEMILYPARTRIPDLKNDYWSSTEYDYHFASTFFFYHGLANNYYKTNPFYVRAVRDWTGETAIELLLKDF